MKRNLNITMFFDRGYPSGLKASAGALAEAQRHDDWNVQFVSVHFHKDITDYLDDPARSPDGILCCGWIYDTLWEYLQAQGRLGSIPMAVADFTENPLCPLPSNAVAVAADDAAVGVAAAETFLARRFSNFAYVGGYGYTPGELHHSAERNRTFRETIAAAGGNYCGHFQPRRENFFGRERTRLAKWLAALPRPCALFVYNDGTAEKLLNVCGKAGIAVPEMVSVIGVDNEEHTCEQTRPQLSSIELDREASGRMAAEHLDLLLRGKKLPRTHLIFGVKGVVERETSVDLRGGGRLVAAATRLIAERACEGMTVTQVARALNVSRSLLNLRFREILGTSVREELLRVKFAKVEQMLATTRGQCAEIARACGWEDVGVLFHLFRRRYGMTMLEWRASHRSRLE